MRRKMLEYFRTGYARAFTEEHKTLMTTHMEVLNERIEALNLTTQDINQMFSRTPTDATLMDFSILYTCVGFVHKTGFRKHHIQFLFILTMTLAYQEHISPTHVNRRWRELSEDFPELSNLAEVPTSHDIVGCWKLIKKGIDKGLDINALTEAVTELVVS